MSEFYSPKDRAGVLTMLAFIGGIIAFCLIYGALGGYSPTGAQMEAYRAKSERIVAPIKERQQRKQMENIQKEYPQVFEK